MTDSITVNVTNKVKAAVRSTLVAALVLPIAAGVETLVLDDQAAYAQSEPSKKKTKRVESIRQKYIKDFEKINEAFSAEDIPAATKVLDKLAKIEPEMNNIERAYYHNFRGNICFNQDKLNCALREFKEVTKTRNGIPDGFYDQMLFVIAQVLFSQEKYKEALSYAQTWFKTQADPSADAYMLIGQAYYQLKDYDKALVNVEKAIKKYEELGSIPREGWLNMLSAIYREKGQYRKMLPVVKQLVQHYPRKNYLLSMGFIFNELEDMPKMTALYQAMYDQGLLASESELNTLSSLHMNQDNPYKAAKIMEKGLNDGIIKKNLKSYRTYSQALYASREYDAALDPLKKAAALSKDGKLYDQLGQAYINLNRWREGEAALNNALKKGGLRSTGQTLVSRGLVQFELKRPKDAIKTFERAKKYEKFIGTANNWIKYVQSEVAREAELAKEYVVDTSVDPAES